MNYSDEIIIALVVLAGYGAIRVVIDLLLAVEKVISKLSNYAQTVEKQYKTTEKVEASTIRVDKRNKYTVNVEACRQYLNSTGKIN